MVDRTVVFILSCTRSGSTWLSLMLGSNSRSAYGGELNHTYGSKQVPCSICTERGVRCPIYDDRSEVRAKHVHDLLLRRTGKDVLVDNSKTLSWSGKHLSLEGVQRKYIHLLRDPRAVVYSWRARRRPKGHERWMKKNYDIRDFLSGNQLDYRIVTYNELAQRTDETLTELCCWLGLKYEAKQKEYWKFEHHGAGKNGATAAYLNAYTSPDKEFYEQAKRTRFHDLRWRDGLSLEEQTAIVGDPEMQIFLSEFQLGLSDAGLERVST